MPVSKDHLEGKLKEAYPDATFVASVWFAPCSHGSLADQTLVILTFQRAYDISGGCGASFEVIIVCSSFEGKNTLKRHREVNEKLKSEIADLHAFTQKTYTPEQFKNVKIVEA
ncbi:hypothetical protein ACM66B_001423 [Microbotryomycetes sp. NB124-2]